MADHAHALLRRARRQQFGDIFQHFCQIELHLFDIHVARFDFGEVQDVADQRQQGFGVLADGRDKMLLLRREQRIRQQMIHADDGVHRGTDFMAHIGQELPLELVGLVGDIPGALQFLSAHRHQVLQPGLLGLQGIEQAVVSPGEAAQLIRACLWQAPGQVVATGGLFDFPRKACQRPRQLAMQDPK